MENSWFSGLALFIYACVFIAVVVAWAEIFLKTGYNRWLCFLMFIPVINVITFFWFAFSKWPIHEFVSRDWRRKLLEDKKAKLEKEISLLTDSSRTEEKATEVHEEEEIEPEDLNDVKQIKEIEAKNDNLSLYVVFGVFIIIIIFVFIYVVRSC
jgi:hypothetical protein